LLGSNDSCLPGSPTQQHLPLSEYRRNVEAIVSHALIQAHKPHKIFLVTPPPINEVQLEEVLVEGQTLSRHQSFTSSYAQAVREVAEQTKNQHVVLIDLWSAMMREATSSTPDYVEGDVLPGSKAAGENKSLRNLLSDGLHMTGAGYKLFLNEVLKAMGGSWLDESFHHKELWVFP
jgi:lysophospholipase L1-like esterase